jgi:hypothetical protein
MGIDWIDAGNFLGILVNQYQNLLEIIKLSLFFEMFGWGLSFGII